MVSSQAQTMVEVAVRRWIVGFSTSSPVKQAVLSLKTPSEVKVRQTKLSACFPPNRDDLFCYIEATLNMVRVILKRFGSPSTDSSRTIASPSLNLQVTLRGFITHPLSLSPITATKEEFPKKQNQSKYRCDCFQLESSHSPGKLIEMNLPIDLAVLKVRSSDSRCNPSAICLSR